MADCNLNPFEVDFDSEFSYIDTFQKSFYIIERLNRENKLSSRKSDNIIDLKYEIVGSEDDETRLIKEEFNNTSHILQELFDVFGDAKGYNLHSALNRGSNIKNETKKELALFLDTYFITTLLPIDFAEDILSGKKSLVIKDSDKLTSDDTLLRV